MAKRGVIDHPKFARLKRALGTNKAATLGYLETLWQFVGRYTPQGNIGKYSDDEIEAWIEWDGEDGGLVAALVKCGWLDTDPTHRLIVHDWASHADSMCHAALCKETLLFASGEVPYLPHEGFSGSTRARIQAEYRVKFGEDAVPSISRGSGSNVPKDAPEVGTPVPINPVSVGTMPEPCQSHALPETDICDGPDPSPSLWDEFCRIYPKRSGALNRAKAEPKFKKLGKEQQAAIDGLKKYRAWCDSTGKTGTELVKQMDSWINGRLWLEDYEVPAPTVRGRVVSRIGSEPDQTQPIEGKDYVLRDNGKGLVHMDANDPARGFDAQAWFRQRNLNPTGKWRAAV